MDPGRVCELGAALGSSLVIPLTVLITVRDTPPAMLDQAIDSILGQTFPDFEFLILDDGSRDEEVRSRLARRADRDRRICLAWEPHRGVTPTLNVGLKRARGEFVARQDADDWSEPQRVGRQLAFMRAHPETALCGCDTWRHQRDGTPLWRSRLPRTHEEILKAFLKGNPFVHGSAMFRRETALEIGGYREAFPCSQDYDFFWRLAEAGGTTNLAEALYHYRYAGDSVSAQRASEQACVADAAHRLAAARRRGEREDVAAALVAAGNNLAGNGGQFRAALKQADHLLLAGEYVRAGRAYANLLRAHPESPLGWGKLLRWAVFATLPPARRACFW